MTIMIKKQSRLTVILLFIAWLPIWPAQAVSFLSFDPRSMALGGAGVAYVPAQNASLFNPALLVTPDLSQPKLFFSIPYAGARLLDRDGFLAAIEQYQDNDGQTRFEDQLAAAKQRYQAGAFSSADLRGVANAARDWRDDLRNLSAKPLRVAASYHVSAGISGAESGWGGHYRRYYVVGAQVNFAQQDDNQISQAIDILDLLADISDNTAEIEALSKSLDLPELSDLIAASIHAGYVLPELEAYYGLPTVQTLVDESISAGELVTELSDYFNLAGLETALKQPSAATSRPKLNQYFTYRPNQALMSDISVQGAYIDETSLGYGFKLGVMPKLQLGVNVKELNITTIDIRSPIQDISGQDLSSSDFHVQYRRLNLDLGLSYLLTSGMRVGLVVKNVIPHDFQTVNNNIIHYRPLARLGLSQRFEQVTLIADLDLTSNDPIGFDPDKQYLSVGVDTHFFNKVSLRFGARSNLVTGKTLPSIGMGLSQRGFEFDVALAQSDRNDELGLAAQLGLMF